MKPFVYLFSGLILGSVITGGTSAVTTPPVSMQDAVKQSPQYYTVLLENDDVRVLEYRLKPGGKEPMHSHTAGIVYTLGDSKIKSTLPDGTATESAAKAGTAFWRDPLSHSLENVGDTDVHALAVEIKKPCKNSAPSTSAP